MIREASPFPPWVSFAIGDLVGVSEADLRPSEQRALSPRAVEKRRLEFAAGRAMARRALRGLGLDPAPAIPVGEDRAPRWPEGIVGAITHAVRRSGEAIDREGSRAAACVAPAALCGGLGLDIERLDGLRRLEVVDQIADAEERRWVGGDRRRVLQLFSAKESVFKALYPRYRRYFGFGAVTATWQPAGAAFSMRLLQDLGPGYPSGRRLEVGVRWTDEQVMTWIWLPPDG